MLGRPSPRSARVLACTTVTMMALATACGDDADGSGGAGGSGGSSGTQGSPSSGTSTASSSPQGQGGTGGSIAEGTSSTGNPTTTSTSTSSDGGGSNGDAPTETVDYVASTETIPNPERGFYTYVDLLDDDFETAIERNHTLVYSYVHLDDYREDDELPEELLGDLDDAFQRLRDSGLKIVLRFAYNEAIGDDDAPLDRVLGHIEQLTETLQDNGDVIAVLQGGFVGAWGEWHSSTNDLTEPAARQAIIEALLAAMPTNRSVVMRNPTHKEAIYGDPLAADDAFDVTVDAARVGHHNDCFLSSESDVGTYPDDAIEEWKQYVEDDTRYVPNGGETCDPFPPRSECESALAEMERLHYSYMNQDYHPDIVESWVDGGCKEEMDQRLGYRFVLVSADLPPAVRPGGSFELHVRVRNDGFAGLMNPRSPMLWLHGGGDSWGHGMGHEMRELLPGETMDLSAHVLVPSDIAEGPAVLSLGLQDAPLADDPRYAIQLANEGTWDGATGLNTLGTIEISNDAPGTSSPDHDTLLANDL